MQLQPWQKDLLTKLDGYHRGEMMVISNGRGIGKSYMKEIYAQFMAAPYRHITEAIVDGEKWYTVSGQKAVCEWIRTQDPKFWFEHIDSTWHISYNTFDIHEKIYTMLGMKF